MISQIILVECLTNVLKFKLVQYFFNYFLNLTVTVSAYYFQVEDGVLGELERFLSVHIYPAARAADVSYPFNTRILCHFESLANLKRLKYLLKISTVNSPALKNATIAHGHPRVGPVFVNLKVKPVANSAIINF